MRKVVKRSATKLTLLSVVIVTVLATLSIPAAVASSSDDAAAPSAATASSSDPLAPANRVATLTGDAKANGASLGAYEGDSVEPALMSKNLKQTLKTSGAAAAAEGIASPQRGTPSANFAPLANFPGLDSENWGDTYEPNVVGDVGPDYYVQVVYSAIGVFDKATGALLGADWLTDFFDAPTGAPCQMVDDQDFEQASVMYDTIHDRWVVVLSTWDDPNNGPFYDCIAVSTSGNPLTGDWNVYQVQTNPAGDIYPNNEQWGLWTDGLYKAADNYCDDACPAEYPDFGYVGIQVFGFNLDDLVSGSALRWQTTTGTGHQAGGTFDYNSFASPVPATMRVQAGVPPVGRPAYFVGNEWVWGEINPNMDVWRWTVNWNNAALSVITAAQTVRAGSVSGGGRNYFQARDQIPAPGGNGLNSNYDYPIGHIQYSNTAGTEALWASQTNDSTAVATTARARARWYRFGITSATGALTNSGGTTATQWQTAPNQGQDFAPDTAVDRWIPSVGVDKNGDMALGYNVVNARVGNPLVYPSIWYTGREVGDPVNTVKTPEQILQTGTGYQVGSVDDTLVTDWSPSSVITLDPDGCTFWLTAEYLTATPVTVDDDQWQTRIGSFAFPSCSPSLLATQLSAKGNGAGGTGTLKATLTATGTGSGVFGKSVDFTLGGNPVGSAVTNNDGVATLPGVDTSLYTAGTNAGVVGASYAGNVDTYSASSITGDLLETGATVQTITFGSLSGKTLGDADFSVSASSDSSLPVSFSASGDCSVTGSNVHLKGAGSCTITASQDGDATYARADNVDQTFAIAKGTQTISGFGTLSDVAVGTNRNVSGTSSAGRQVQFTTTTPAKCTSRLNGIANSARIDSIHTGTCTVEASVPADADYLAVAVTQSFQITAALTQTCTIGGNASRRIDQGQPLATAVTCTSGLNATSFAVTASATNPANIAPAPASVSMSTSASFTITAGTSAGAGANRTETVTCSTCGAGSSIIVGNTVTIAGVTPTTYNATAVVIAKTATTITVGRGNTNPGTYTSGGTISISGASETGTTATVNTTTAHGFTTGTGITVSGVTPGGYNGAWTIASTPLGQGLAQATAATITYSTSPTSGLGVSTVAGTVATSGAGATETGNTVTLTTGTAHGFSVGESLTVAGVGVSGYNGTFTAIAPTSGTTVTYTNPTAGLANSGGGTVARSAAACSAGGSPGAETLTLIHVGTCTVTATQAGNDDYPAATPVTKVFTITAGQDTITFSPTTNQTAAPWVEVASLSPAVAGTVYGLTPGTITSTTPGTCSVSGTTPGTGTSGVTVTPIAAGTCTLSAAGHLATSDWAARAATTQNITITLTSQAITFDPIADQVVGAAPVDLVASSSSGLTVSFSASGPCSIVAGPKVSPDGAGLCTVTASQAGNGLYSAATPVQRSFTITTAGQTITFDPIDDQIFGAAPVDLVASASSGLTVSFTAAGPCSIVSGPKVSLDGGGLCTVTAHQAGNGTYSAAPDVDQSFTIQVGGQVINLTGTWATDHHTLGDADFNATATASSGLDVTFTAAGHCTVAGTPNSALVHLTSGGLCTITAHQPGNDDFDAATDVDAAFTVFQNQTINGFAAIPNKSWGDPDFMFATGVSATSGLTVTYTITGPCSIVGGPGPGSLKVHITGTGLCTVTAHQAGNASYNPAPDVSRAFTISARATTTTLKITPKTVHTNGSITATANVKPVGVKKLFPTGSTVEFRVGASVLGTATVNAKGVAKATFSVPLAPGQYNVIAVLLPSTNFSGSQSAANQNKLKVIA